MNGFIQLNTADERRVRHLLGAQQALLRFRLRRAEALATIRLTGVILRSIDPGNARRRRLIATLNTLRGDGYHVLGPVEETIPLLERIVELTKRSLEL